MLIHIIRTGNHYDYVKEFILDSLIESQTIVKFKRATGWVTIGTDPIRTSRRDSAFYGADRRKVNNSMFAGI